MKILIASIAAGNHSEGFKGLTATFLARLPQYTQVEARTFRTEAAFLEGMEKLRVRTAPVVVLLDSRGKGLSSEELAAWIGQQRDSGAQNLVFAVGPADGWSAPVSDFGWEPAGMLLSLGRMTLPHELARLVLVEQVYRAFTILYRHPYHRGH